MEVKLVIWATAVPLGFMVCIWLFKKFSNFIDKLEKNYSKKEKTRLYINLSIMMIFGSFGTFAIISQEISYKDMHAKGGTAVIIGIILIFIAATMLKSIISESKKKKISLNLK